jgi:hypothetical protein
MKNDSAFNQKVTDSIDRAFDSLGDSIELVLYLTLEKEFGLSKEDIPAKFDSLSEVLKRIFGHAGRDFMIKLISEELIEEFDLPLPEAGEEKSVTALLKKARERYLSKGNGLNRSNSSR